MNEYKVVITKNEEKINQLLQEGWLIGPIIAQHVASGGIRTSTGKFLIVFYKSKLNKS